MPKTKPIDSAIVKRVAELARLKLSDKELALYSGQLADIITYIGKLNEVETSGVSPTCHPLDSLKNVFRKDVVKKSLSADDALRNAPSSADGFFRVPKIINQK
ncbi:MAG: Asp-tRNA(Asn)/Glu-tRNA(Gln) amidotransferase subunit GatC [Candidatus Omnitrophota bacterium]